MACFAALSCSFTVIKGCDVATWRCEISRVTGVNEGSIFQHETCRVLFII